MKRVLVVILAFTCALSMATSAMAADGKKKGKKQPLTAEQEALKKDFLAKYDTDKDGKLSKEERSKITKTDRKKLGEVGLRHKKKGKEKEN